jgi:hypothetical protein
MHDTTLTHIPLEQFDNVAIATPPVKHDPDATQRARRALELAETAPDGTPALAPTCKVVPTDSVDELAT